MATRQFWNQQPALLPLAPLPLQGLRTLVLGTKIIPEEQYLEWDARYQEAGERAVPSASALRSARPARVPCSSSSSFFFLCQVAAAGAEESAAC